MATQYLLCEESYKEKIHIEFVMCENLTNSLNWHVHSLSTFSVKLFNAAMKYTAVCENSL